MFGQNAISKAEYGDGESLRVNEIFSTIQGEGPFAGRPAIFVRLAGCNLACHFCDTEFEKTETMSLDEVLTSIRVTLAHFFSNADLVVITGGEPMLQQIIPLCTRLLGLNFDVQIETAGTVWPPAIVGVSFEDLVYGKKAARFSLQPYSVHIVCSPKTPKIHPMVELYCSDYKYIVEAGDEDAADGLSTLSTQRIGIKAPVFRPDPAADDHIWVQPMAVHGRDGQPNDAKTKANMLHAARVAMTRNYRLSLQTHKILGLP